MEAYRRGHNEPDSKSGCPPGHVGSNPTASVLFRLIKAVFLLCVYLQFIRLRMVLIGRRGAPDAFKSTCRRVAAAYALLFCLMPMLKVKALRLSQGEIFRCLRRICMC